MKYELYGYLHRIAKKILHRDNTISLYRMINVQNKNIDKEGKIILKEKEGTYINDMPSISKNLNVSDVFPVENIVPSKAFLSFEDSFKKSRKCKKSQLGVTESQAVGLWMEFIKASKIPNRYRNGDLHYAGYILDCEEWCLPSWVWTNAAIVKMYCRLNMTDKAKIIVDKLIEVQEECGGWIVRNDYNKKGAIPVLAPNDSAYVANNACLEFYLLTGNKMYLDAAIKCADWIIDTAREDGIDCKATSVIACSLMNWYVDHSEQRNLKSAAEKAYKWCIKHTLPEGRGRGGIYSYTTEGAIVHHLYTWTAFVYGSSYAIELQKIISEENLHALYK